MLNSGATECVEQVEEPTEQVEEPTEQEPESVELETETNHTPYSYGTYAVLAIGVVSSVGASMVKGGSPQGAWAMINQLQTLILLPLMFRSFSDKIINYILSMDAAIFSFNFITIKDVLPDQETRKVEFDQPNNYLKLIGLEDGSTFANNLSLFFIILGWMIFHLLIWILY